MSNPTEGHCYHCDSHLTAGGACPEGHCTREESDEHFPDWKTLKLADGEAIGPGGFVVFDVECAHCGHSGSIGATLTPEKVDW